MRAVLAALMMAISVMNPAVAEPLEDGLAAFRKGDYATALLLWRPLAEEGHAVAQSNLARMYYSGTGVPQDYVQAAQWYRRAAEKGDRYAQNNLSDMYRDGHGVPQDYVQAYMWFSLSSASSPRSGLDRDSLTAKMTAAQIAEAERLAREWKPMWAR